MRNSRIYTTIFDMMLFFDTISPCIMSVQYTGGCAVHRGMFSTLGGFMSTVGDTMSTPGDVQYTGGLS